MTDSVFLLLKTFLKRENYKINFDELRLQLLSHPSYPSLHSITGVLNHFDIENMALELPCNLDIFSELPENFIAVSKKKQYLLVKKSNHTTHVLFEDGKKEILTYLEFLDIWDGIIVGIEPPVNIPNQTQLGGKIQETILFSTIAILLGIYFVYTGSTTFMTIHLLLGIIGLGISILILKQELGYHSIVVDKICKTNNSTTNCDAVLQSKGSKIFGNLKLSDLSIIYFAGLTLAWITTSIVVGKQNALSIITVSAMPITIYSIYYQYQVIKKWCPLCLGIVGILWLQAFSLIFKKGSIDYLNLTFKELAVLTLSFLIVTSIWLSLRPLLISNQSLVKLRIDYYKFKRNFDLFFTVLNKSTKLDTSIANYRYNEVVLGNRNASLELLLVTNPQCFYCKAAHEDIEKILHGNYQQLRVVIRFKVNSTDYIDLGSRVCVRLLELYNEETIEVFKGALNEAYSFSGNLENWILKWGELKNRTAYGPVLKHQQEWCAHNNIHFTPALFINGMKFPSEYERQDLLFFVDDLTDLLEENTEVKDGLVSIM